MRYISPSLLREYLFCPRSFFYRKLQKYSLLSSTSGNALAQERIDNFTSGFFSTLRIWNEETSSKNPIDLEYLLSSKFFTHLAFFQTHGNQPFRELDEKVFTMLLWLTIHLWETNTPNDKQLPYFTPLMVNEFIKAPEIQLQGRPSAIFRQPNDSALIFIQTFHQKLPQIHSLQAAIYARILQSMEIGAENYLYVNYFQMDVKFEQLRQSDFINLDKFLNNFRIAIREGSFDPPKSPPCENCEFKWICKE
ncbi:MAG: PD-(D/E)XK nuclease family protein [Promethearchaeota archaeon]